MRGRGSERITYLAEGLLVRNARVLLLVLGDTDLHIGHVPRAMIESGQHELGREGD